jgi:hypothetical protein
MEADQKIFINNTQFIKEILRENKNGERDNDVQLYVSLCYRLGIDLTQITAMDLVKNQKNYPYMPSAVRIRAMLQLEHKDLRGEMYDERIDHRRKLAKHEIKEAQSDERGQYKLGVA